MFRGKMVLTVEFEQDRRFLTQYFSLHEQWMELKTDGLCAGVVGNSTDAKKADNTRVYLQECIEGMRSQQWRQASTSQLVNLLSRKCLEAGN